MIPEPDHTPDGPRYEGRTLDRPDDEVVDQGAGFDLRTLVSRRGILGIAGLGVGAVALAACTAVTDAAASLGDTDSDPHRDARAHSDTDRDDAPPAGEIPDETAGPYPGDGSNGPDVLAQSGIVRSDLRTSIGGGMTADGAPSPSRSVSPTWRTAMPVRRRRRLRLALRRAGNYSMYSSGVENETYLRGVQVADGSGQVTFTSIVPGCYSGRWPHIHFEVYPSVDLITDSANAISTSQLALPEEMLGGVYALPATGSAQNLAGVSLATDNVFGDDGGALQIATVTGDSSAGFTAMLTARVDTSTAPTGGSMGGGRAGADTPPRPSRSVARGDLVDEREGLIDHGRPEVGGIRPDEDPLAHRALAHRHALSASAAVELGHPRLRQLRDESARYPWKANTLPRMRRPALPNIGPMSTPSRCR
jgi:protocatechuate 3,4-dioxygenase beta subunit